MATIEIDGKTLDIETGKMIIEAAHEAGIHIPHFCYHKKLSIAANCRMCLVQIDKSKKPVPACATPIADGMKVYTKSEEAVRSQKAVMEFLLINHPLDCPICDQGGECELQDVSMGYGQGVSDYAETKRVAPDPELGTLVATEMTRCIHCTRCVRFGDEIAGVRELGAVDRGGKMKISTFVERALTSEVSGNIIDLCPVGALTSKPFQYRARAWEMTAYPGIAPHDCLGSHLSFHVLRNKVLRVVPRECEQINEVWLSDRDRFSYLGLDSPYRAQSPMIKRHGQWESVSWEEALTFAADGLMHLIKEYGAEQFAAFASPSSTIEELYLLQKLMRAHGVNNLDHRLMQRDFSDESRRTVMPENTISFSGIESCESIVVLGCNIHREVPLAGIRLRKAVRLGAQAFTINPVDYDLHCDVAEKIITPPMELLMQLATLALAFFGTIDEAPAAVRHLLLGLVPSEAMLRIAHALKTTKAVIVTGAICENHADAACIRALLDAIHRYCNVSLIHFTQGANAAGAWAAGMLPHRTAGGRDLGERRGLHVHDAIQQKLKGYWLHGVEPEYDFDEPHVTRSALLSAEFVIVTSPFYHESMQDYADVILPSAIYAETSGTFVNVDNTWQSFNGAIAPHASCRPAWKIFRVLANIMHTPGFDFSSTEAVLSEIHMHMNLAEKVLYQPSYPEALPGFSSDMQWLAELSLYRVDALVRHAEALQHCGSRDTLELRMHPNTATRLQLESMACISSGDIALTLPLMQDPRVPEGVVAYTSGMPEMLDMGGAPSSLIIKPQAV